MLRRYIGNESIDKKDILLSIVFSFLLMLCVYPSFLNTGKLIFQIISTVVLSSSVSFAALHIKNGLKIIAIALNIFFVVLIFYAFGWQIILQIKNSIHAEPFNGWINTFYYDKSMTIGIAWFSVTTVFTILRLIINSNKNNSYEKDFINFFNISSRGFILYYAILLFYSFVLIRDIGSNSSEANFIPFNTIVEYANYRNYEMFMYFFGNLLLFTPFGFYTIVIKQKNRFVNLLMLPILISSVIEFSQLLFKSGNCDIDDVILNSLGFYLGVLIKVLADKIISKGNNRSDKTIFVWLPYSLFSLKAH